MAENPLDKAALIYLCVMGIGALSVLVFEGLRWFCKRIASAKRRAEGVCIAGERCSCACLVRTDLRARCNLWQPRKEKSHDGQ